MPSNSKHHDFLSSTDILGRSHHLITPANEGQEPWQSLRDDLMRNKSSPDHFPRYRGDLYLIADLLRASRVYYEQQFGSDFWEQAEQAYAGNPRAITCLRLHRCLSTLDRRDAVIVLSEIGREGIVFEVPSRQTLSVGHQDCGLTEFVQTTRGAADLITRCRQRKGARGHVVTLTKCGQALKLFYGDRKGAAVSGQMKDAMLILLHSPERTARDEVMWEAVWPNKRFLLGEKAGANEHLRSLASRINKKLKHILGPPPTGERWLERPTTAGYALNSSVQWKLRLD